ncbi:MAG: hypothetical protein J6W70_09275 [Lentisphaeria bacterium]|nr:hypothetical protein [Lentisphaeria bacterium]
MYFLEVSFWLFYVPYALVIGIVSRIRKRELSDVFMMLVIGVYVVFALRKFYFPMPVVSDAADTQQYSYLEVENYYLPLSFVKNYMQIWCAQIVGSIPFGMLAAMWIRKKGILVVLLTAGSFSVLAVIMNIVANKLSGLNYISLATDSCMSYLFGALIGEGIVVMLQRLIRKEQSE